jgi:predicted GH43/DUF377 family glycosyl hydrolase
VARSTDGFRFTADLQPFLVPEREGPFAAYEEFGVEDPRVTRLEDEYLITYSAYSRSGVRIALAGTRDFTHEMKIGPGAPPFKTEQGWLSIYHGVFRTMDGAIYRLGVALHDLQNPAKVIGVGDSWNIAAGRSLGDDRLRPQRCVHVRRTTAGVRSNTFPQISFQRSAAIR